MVQKKMWHEEDDTLQSQINQDIADTQEYDLLNIDIHQKHNGKVPSSRWDQGRNCPRCSGRLVYKEHTAKNQNVLLMCKSCGMQVFAEDIDYEDPLSDQLYRTIPLSMQLYWDAFRKSRHANEEETP